jgi:hypothetical protein
VAPIYRFDLFKKNTERVVRLVTPVWILFGISRYPYLLAEILSRRHRAKILCEAASIETLSRSLKVV